MTLRKLLRLLGCKRSGEVGRSGKCKTCRKLCDSCWCSAGALFLQVVKCQVLSARQETRFYFCVSAVSAFTLAHYFEPQLVRAAFCWVLRAEKVSQRLTTAPGTQSLPSRARLVRAEVGAGLKPPLPQPLQKPPIAARSRTPRAPAIPPGGTPTRLCPHKTPTPRYPPQQQSRRRAGTEPWPRWRP